MIDFVHSPIFGLGITVIIYVLSLRLREKLPWIHPLFVCSLSLIVLLAAADISYEQYRFGGDILTYMLGPATVALAVPLHKNWQAIRAHSKIIIPGITIGIIVSFGASALCIYLFDGTRELLMTLLPKSATTPISIEIVRKLGGIPELGAVFTVLTGLFGSMFGVWFCRVIGLKSDMAIGIAMGTAAHGIGTAKILKESERQGAFSSLAMGVAGILVSVFSIGLYYLT
ncbi:LrgB family protein [Paenibacillus sp. strain BS8-2]